HWLATNGGVQRFPRLIVIAYKSAEEGVTFCSNWSTDPAKDASWHLTHIDALGLSKSSCCSAIEQRLGRINGNHGDGMVPIVYCTDKCQEKLIKGFNFHFEQIKMCCDHQDDVPVPQFLMKKPMYSNRVPPKCYNIQGAKWKLTLEYNPEQDLEDETVCLPTKASKILQVINPTGYRHMLSRTLQNEEDIEQKALQLRDRMVKVHQERVPVCWNQLISSYNSRNGKVRKIIDAFSKVDFASLTEEELVNVCGGKFQYDNYIRWDIRKNKYRILDKVGKNFILRADVIEKLGLFD
ncbi:MAG: hypothetical protein JSS09_00760, partial [Verrucomicrobia bacterium]|nr:hypothetical protein [Verrucomicrobiota bacterium]